MRITKDQPATLSDLPEFQICSPHEVLRILESNDLSVSNREFPWLNIQQPLLVCALTQFREVMLGITHNALNYPEAVRSLYVFVPNKTDSNFKASTFCKHLDKGPDQLLLVQDEGPALAALQRKICLDPAIQQSIRAFIVEQATPIPVKIFDPFNL